MNEEERYEMRRMEAEIETLKAINANANKAIGDIADECKVLALSRAELEAKVASLQRRLDEYESRRAMDEGR